MPHLWVVPCAIFWVQCVWFFSKIEFISFYLDHSKTRQFLQILTNNIINPAPIATRQFLSICNLMTSMQLYLWEDYWCLNSLLFWTFLWSFLGSLWARLAAELSFPWSPSSSSLLYCRAALILGVFSRSVKQKQMTVGLSFTHFWYRCNACYGSWLLKYHQNNLNRGGVCGSN